MRRGGLGLRSGWPSHVSHWAERGRSASGGRLSAGCFFSSSARSSQSCSLSQGCKTALVTETTPFARSRPVAGRKKVRSLAVPPRSYSCGWSAGWPSGCARRLQAAGWLDRAQLHLRSTAQSPPLLPARRLVRSVFFFRRLRVIRRHGPAFAHPQRVAGTNPGAGLLKAVA